MTSWIDLHKIFVDIKGDFIHVVNDSSESLEKILIEHNFSVYKINGNKIFDEETFFKEVAQVFGFPAYFGNNWAAWDDSLGDFGNLAPNNVAIIWEGSGQTFISDEQLFLQAICDLYNLAAVFATPQYFVKSDKKQIEVFILK